MLLIHVLLEQVTEIIIDLLQPKNLASILRDIGCLQFLIQRL